MPEVGEAECIYFLRGAGFVGKRSSDNFTVARGVKMLLVKSTHRG